MNVVDLLTLFYNYLYAVWTVIRMALNGNKDLLQYVEQYPFSFWITLTVALIAGASLLVGQSVVLYINRVPRNRLLYTLGLNGILYALSEIFQATVIWVIARLWLHSDQSLDAAIRIIFLASAPLVLSFLILIPYLGTVIDWGLHIWSLLITLQVVEYTFRTDLAQAVWVTLLGWVLVEVISHTVSHPFLIVRDAIWRFVTGTAFTKNIDDEIDEAVHDLRKELQGF